jgi:RHS repeat-associated protein
VTNPAYTYDANGAMLTGAGRTVTMASFDMALGIVQGTTSTVFRYDPEHQRTGHAETVGGVTTNLADVSDPGTGASAQFVSNTTTWHYYLMVDGHYVARRTCTGAPTCGSASWTYFVTDHLGSVVSITDGTGAVVQRSSFDPWGRPRNPATGADDPGCGATPAPLTSRGFTGHERMDGECLINANARIYDPTIGRFMVADTVVSDAFDSQGLNRYSYVDNRPLSATDPSGHVETVIVTAARKYPNRCSTN